MATSRHTGSSRSLSEAAQHYLLALRSMSGAGMRPTAAAVARRLGVSSQAVSEMVHRLVQDGLVEIAQDRVLKLTPAGRRGADAIFRRHALLEWLLTRVVGLGWAESDEEALRLQGAISPRVEERLAALLGNPPTCPHGNPIDSRAAKTRPAGVPLSQAHANSEVTIYRITEEAEEDAELLAYLEQNRLFPGAVVRVVEVSAGRDTISLDGPNGRSTIGRRPAELIRFLPGRADRALFHTVPAIVTE